MRSGEMLRLRERNLSPAPFALSGETLRLRERYRGEPLRDRDSSSCPADEEAEPDASDCALSAASRRAASSWVLASVGFGTSVNGQYLLSAAGLA